MFWEINQGGIVFLDSGLRTLNVDAVAALAPNSIKYVAPLTRKLTRGLGLTSLSTVAARTNHLS